MNYLMHLYLSNNDEELMVGNFIADDVKGNKVYDYPPGISQGIILHRAIDDFSDRHPAVRQSAAMLRPLYGKYAGVAVDVFYDHFLAVNFNQYSSTGLDDFAGYCYRTMLKNWGNLPWSVKLFLPFVIKHKRLQSYAKFTGLTEALLIMSKYSRFPNKAKDAVKMLKVNYSDFGANFETFFPDVQAFSNARIAQI